MRQSKSRFAEIAATLEDMHAVAVEGDQPDLSSDMRAVFGATLRLGSARLALLIADATSVSR